MVAGRSAELHAVQEIAEWASRAGEPRATFTVLLHQTLTNYASGLGQSGRAAWRKVEGRFSVLRFVEDSREMYELLARVAGEGRAIPADAGEVGAHLDLARRAKGAGWFEAFPDAEALAPVLHASRRLAPAALHLLPLLSARLAQNERTVFGFLHGLGDEVAGLGALYRHFGEAMRTDTGLGGTHRRWIETESALARAEDDVEREALRAACLLQLGVGGERRRLRRGALIEAVAGGGAMADGASAAVDRLLERKLLLHRLRNDDVSIWHGVDLDVEGRLAEARPRLLATLDVPAALEAAMPAPFQRPLRHNAQKAVGRFFEGRYVDAAALAKAGTAHSAVASSSRDGRILYALAGSRDAILALRELARGDLAGRDDLVLVIPKDPLDVADVLAEVAALAEMRRDPELLGEDPLVGQEVDELAAVAHEQLGRMVERLTDPARGACAWWAAGEDLGVDAGVPVGEALSRLADRRFPRTPRLRNEQLVRRTVSRVMVNARKRALIGILERDDTPSFGLAGATTPDASICRTLLEATGLHAQHPDGRLWSEPEEVADDDLREVWSRIRSFFAEPSAVPKAPEALLRELRSPPFGLREGVLPVLIGAGLRAFGRCVAIREDESYVGDVVPSTIEDLCAHPERFEVEVRAPDEEAWECLDAVRRGFGVRQDEHERDRVRACFDAIRGWQAALPKAALSTRDLSADGLALQRALKTEHDPIDLLFRALPAFAGRPTLDRPTVERVAAARREMEGVTDGFIARAIKVMNRAFDVRVGEDAGVLERASAWAGYVRAAEPGLTSVEAGVVRAAASAASGRFTEAAFARALSMRLLGRDFHEWTDGTERDFERALRGVVDAAERALVAVDQLPREAAPLIGGRIEDLARKLSRTVGTEETMALLEKLMKDISR